MNQLPQVGEEALGLGQHGPRVVQPQEPPFEARVPERAGRRQLVEEFRRVLPEDDIHRLSVGDGPAVLHGEVARAHHLPFPPERAGHPAEEVGEAEFLAMCGVHENGQPATEARCARSALYAAHMARQGSGQGAAEAGPSAAVRVRSPRLPLFAGPDLSLTGGLVAVVLEHGQSAAGPFEDIEATPEERGAQRARREDLLRQGELRWLESPRRVGPREQGIGETPQEPVQRDGEARELTGERRREHEWSRDGDVLFTGSALLTPVEQQVIGPGAAGCAGGHGTENPV